MRRLFWLLLSLLPLMQSSCDNGFLPATLIQSLRVISVVMDPPEIAPGQHTTLTPTLSPGFEDATVTWAACRLPTFPGQGLINTDCFNETPETYLIPLGSSPTLDFQMPPDLKVTDLGTPDSSTGFYLPVRFIVTKGDSKLMGFARVRYYLGMQPANSNPTFDSIVKVDFNNDMGPEATTPVVPTIAVAAASKVSLRATVLAASLEQYTRVADLQTLALQTVNEQVRIHWFSQAGKFDVDTTGYTIDTVGVPPLPTTNLDLSTYPPDSLPADVTVWAVMTDERGGQAIQTFQLHVQ